MRLFIWDFVANTVMDAILDWCYEQVVGFLGGFFSQMGYMGSNIFQISWVQGVVEFFYQLGWALFAVSLVIAAFECAIQYSSGRADIKGTALNIIKGFMAVSLFTIVPVRLYELAVSLQGSLTMGIAGVGDVSALGTEIMSRLEADKGLVESIASMNVGDIRNPIVFSPLAALTAPGSGSPTAPPGSRPKG